MQTLKYILHMCELELVDFNGNFCFPTWIEIGVSLPLSLTLLHGSYMRHVCFFYVYRNVLMQCSLLLFGVDLMNMCEPHIRTSVHIWASIGKVILMISKKKKKSEQNIILNMFQNTFYHVFFLPSDIFQHVKSISIRMFWPRNVCAVFTFFSVLYVLYIENITYVMCFLCSSTWLRLACLICLVCRCY